MLSKKKSHVVARSNTFKQVQLYVTDNWINVTGEIKMNYHSYQSSNNGNFCKIFGFHTLKACTSNAEN